MSEYCDLLGDTLSVVINLRDLAVRAPITGTEYTSRVKPGPSTPMSLEHIHQADEEAATVAVFAEQFAPLPAGFWRHRVSGEILGLHTDGLPALEAVVEELIYQAEHIQSQPGVDKFVRELRALRARSYAVMGVGVRSDDEWVDMDTATNLTGKNSRTISRWLQRGEITCRGEGAGRRFSRTSLGYAVERMEAKNRAGRFGAGRTVCHSAE